MAQPYRMPPRGASGAPSFDPIADSRSIIGFFEDLDFCLDQAGITDDGQKKGHAVRYVPDSEKTIWRAFTEFTDNSKSYDDFKKVVKIEYIGADGVSLFSRRDLDLHVAATSSTTINSAKEFNVYSRKFRDIASFLVTGRQLRADDRDHLFLHGLPPVLRTEVLDRLRITVPTTRYPRDPYSITEVTEAVHHTLEAATLSAATPTAAAPAVTATPQIKSEFTQAVESLATIAAAFMQAQTAPAATATPSAAGSAPPFHQRPLPPHMAPPGNPAAPPPPPRTCFYCNDANHGIRTCPLVDTDLAAGLVRRNDRNQVTLPNGSFVPNTVAGATLRERVQRYHQLYPEVRAPPQGAGMPQLFFAPVQHTASAAEPTYALATISAPPPRTRDYGNALEQQIEARRLELYALEQQGSRRTRLPSQHPFRRSPVRASTPPSTAHIEEVPDEPANPTAPHTTPAATNPTPVTSALPTAPPSAPLATSLEHPFANARDATYAPPSQRNYGIPPPRAPLISKKPDPAYRARPPVYDPRHVAKVLRRCLEQPIMVTKEELLSMSPEFCASTRELCTTRKVPTEPVLSQDETPLPFVDVDESPADPPSHKHDTLLSSLPVAFEAAQGASSARPPPGTLVVPDPVDMYFRSLPPDAERKPVKVSVESAAIRAIPGTFGLGTVVSCIHDDGCSIVSMSEGVCHHLGLSYDPQVILQMQSANGACDYSLGLARNVPVRFGSITVYLQFHVIRSPAYDVLLGRPFDLLTSSIVHTKSDGSQTITLHDPNSDTVATIPTAPRRPPEFVRADPSKPGRYHTTVEDVPEDFRS
uniref:Plp n=1 Tax=Ganoderma boninense TaxID=34458 RepID=A0A5K1JU50_9APHY|nr:Plp [Ganoderma boninense]